MPKIAIAVKSLSKHFVTRKNRVIKAVDDLTFTVKPGTTVGLLGGNGAGKTTTINMLAGILLPTSGEVRVLGEDIIESRYNVLQRMNFSSPYVDIPQKLTVWENLNVYAHLYNVKKRKERIESLAKDLHIDDFLDRPIVKLSAGQKTRVSLAKSLINTPQVLLLDEPTASLDPDTADWIRTYLENYIRSQKCAVLLASHNMGEVERLCENILMMRAGKIADEGTPKALIKKYGRSNMEEVFLDIARNTQTAA